MKVQELIELLNGADPEAVVVLAMDQDPINVKKDAAVAFRERLDIDVDQRFWVGRNGAGCYGDVGKNSREAKAIVLWSF